MYLLNAIPGALIPAEGINLLITPALDTEIADAFRAGTCTSAIGHADTAALIGNLIGVEVPMARISVPALAGGDVHFLGLYQGPRLPEGATALPEGATISFYRLVAGTPAYVLSEDFQAWLTGHR